MKHKKHFLFLFLLFNLSYLFADSKYSKEELLIGLSGGLSIPVSPVGSNSFSVSYKDTLIINAEFGYIFEQDFVAYLSVGYIKFYHKFLEGSINFIPILLLVKYDFLKLSDNSTIFVKGGGGISFNKLTSATYNPAWINLSYRVSSGISFKIDNNFTFEIGISSNGFLSKNSDEDILQILSFEGAIIYKLSGI